MGKHKPRELTHPSSDQSRNILLIILIAPSPLSIRKRNANIHYWMQSLPNAWRLNCETREVCRGFSVKSNSFPSRTRTTNPENLPTTTISDNLLYSTLLTKNQINNTTVSGSRQVGILQAKPSSTIRQEKCASKQSSPKPGWMTEETQKAHLRKAQRHSHEF